MPPPSPGRRSRTGDRPPGHTELVPGLGALERALGVGVDRLRRRWVLVVVIVLLGAGAGLGWALWHSGTYTGRSAMTIQKVGDASPRRTKPESVSTLLTGYADYFNLPATQAIMRQKASVPANVAVSARVAGDTPVLYVEATGADPKAASTVATDMASTLRDDVRDNLGVSTLSAVRRDRVAAADQIGTLPGGSPQRRALDERVSRLDRQIATLEDLGAAAQLQALQSEDGVSGNPSHAPRYAAAGGAAGLLVGALLALLLGQGENRIVSAEIARTLGLRTLAVVDGSRRRGTDAPGRRARDLLPLVNEVGSARLPVPVTMAVTAVGPGRVKSGVADVLASLRAQQGQRTLLVQTDVDRTTAVPALGGRRGVTDLLEASSGPRAAEDAGELERHVVDNGRDLLLAPLGSRATGGFRLYARAPLTDLLTRTRALADLVVVDAPAVLAAPEAEVVCSVANVAVLVLEEGRTRATDAVRAVEALRRSHVNLIGAILVRSAADVTDPKVLDGQSWTSMPSGAAAITAAGAPDRG